MAKFIAKTYDQINAESLIPAKTECDVEIIEATDAVSSTGNDMIVLTLKAYHGEGHKIIKDYILFKFEYKFRTACDSFGILDAYNSENVSAEDFGTRSGKAIIGIQAASDKYDAKNVISSYVPRPAEPTKVDLDDEIPLDF